MKKHVGIYINDRKAIIISTINRTTTHHSIHAEVPIDSPLRDLLYILMNKVGQSPQERLKYKQAQFYQSILDYVQDASDVFIFGPGHAKLALKKVMEFQQEYANKTIQVSLW